MSVHRIATGRETALMLGVLRSHLALNVENRALEGLLSQRSKDPQSRALAVVPRMRKLEALVGPQPDHHQQDGALGKTGVQVRSLASSSMWGLLFCCISYPR